MRSLYSIIIPFHNVDKTIINTLESLLIQSFTQFEIILINDDSTDNSLEIVQNYLFSDKRVKLINTTERSGAGFARNMAIKTAIGDYILFLDADDRLLNSHSLERINEFLLSGPDVLLFQYLYSSNDFTNNRFTQSKYETKFWNRFKYSNNQEVFEINHIPEVLLFPAYPWNKVFKRSFVEKKIRFSETRCHNDLKFSWHALIAAESICVLPEPIVLHDTDDDKPRITNNSSMNRLDLFQACAETEEILKKENVSDQVLSYYQKFKWDAFNWGKFRIMRDGLWKFVYTYHLQLLKTPLHEKKMFLNEHAISTKEKLKFQAIVYFPYIYWAFLSRRLRNE